MRTNIRLLLTGGACIGLLIAVNGCSSVTRGTPVAGTHIQANMNTGDCEVLAKTEGKSTKTSILLGLVQVIDGDKYRILGIKFFEDQYAFESDNPSPFDFLVPVSVENRAYYKALAAAPDADAVAAKGYMKTYSGIPIIYNTKEVTFEGKALKFKGAK
jgi:hypothetical protein